MPAGQRSGTGAMTELDDEEVRKNDILSNRDKSQRLPGQDLDRTGIQVDEYKDIPTNKRPEKDDAPEAELSKSEESIKQVDRPGFDLGGSTGEGTGGKGLGLGVDAKEDRDGWGLPR
ncbi:hypothetical protein BV511_15240 [Methylorubrum extorquens]|nr:hypothetical protein BV511_15240 [Methylorubrum extorquens]